MADTPAAPKMRTNRLHRHLVPTAVYGADASADGKTLYAACMDGVYEVNGETGAHQRLYGHESYASGVVVFGESGLLISAGYDGALKWYDLNARREVRTVPAHQFWSWQMARSQDGKRVASVTGQYLAGSYKYEPAPEKEPSVRVYDVQSGKLLQSFSHLPPVQSVAFSPDGRFVAAGNLMGEVRVFDVDAGKQVAAWKTDAFTCWGIIKSHHYVGGIWALTFTPDGEHIIAAGMGPMTDPMAGNGRQLWQKFAWKENPPRQVDQTHAGESGEGLMETLAIHPSGECFVMSGRLRGGQWNTAVFGLPDGAIKHSLKTETRISRAVFVAGGQRLVLGGAMRQPGFQNKEMSNRPFGHVDVFEFSLT